jgi:hypothetical protein
MVERGASFSHIRHCLDVTERDQLAALGDRDTARALLERLAKVSSPREGAPKVLIILARLAQEEVEWIEGMLRVELAESGEGTAIDVLCELGVGMRERVFPPFTMNAPLAEFTRVAESAPKSVAPLSIRSKSARKLVLKALWQDDDDKSSVLPPAVSIADESLYGGSARGAQPKARSRSSSDLRAPRRSSKPDVPAVKPEAIPARSGKTLRPPPSMSTPPRRTSTLRPEKGVPPPRPSVANMRAPRAAPIPRDSPRAAPIPRDEPTGKPKRKSLPHVSPKPAAVEAKPARGRAIPRSEPPDEEGIDEGWKDSER